MYAGFGNLFDHNKISCAQLSQPQHEGSGRSYHTYAAFPPFFAGPVVRSSSRCPLVVGMSSSFESSGLPVTGFFEGEELLLMVRIFTTLVSVSVVSAWFSWKKIGRLGLFFTHWLA